MCPYVFKNLSVYTTQLLMKPYLILIFFTLCGQVPGQSNQKVYNLWELEKEPEYPEGQAAFLKYLSQHIEYPIITKEERVCGKMEIQFVIDKKGKAKYLDCKFLNCDLSCGNIKKVIQQMPRWKPGIKDGKAVSVAYKLPMYVHWE